MCLSNTVRDLLRRAGEHHRLLKFGISFIWNTYEEVIFTGAYIRYYLNEGSVNPTLLINLEVDAVEYIHTDEIKFDFIRDAGRSLDGEWDTHVESITSTERYESFAAHFEEGIPWEQTALYKRLRKKAASSGESRYVSVESVDEKFELYDELYDVFSEGQYQTQGELRGKLRTVPGEGGVGVLSIFKPGLLFRHEVAINTGREGEPIIQDGKNRVMIAKLAGLTHVPARIVITHEQSQRSELLRKYDRWN